MGILALFPFDCSLAWSILEAEVEIVELAGTSGSHMAHVSDRARQQRPLASGQWQELMGSKEMQTINWLEHLRRNQKELDKID